MGGYGIGRGGGGMGMRMGSGRTALERRRCCRMVSCACRIVLGGSSRPFFEVWILGIGVGSLSEGREELGYGEVEDES